ncbi:DNA-binding GntR family transcriptional regulator [Sediminihabitans luteus]|uniref:DNA-binding GntR family transcriptional regulator n=1 Tax=Sediminihabitans luteus TaxID=1138585 RepID=A0A2M9CER4_9CELL|nr:GntR family transcriptional regulator [Sediminihabitans luteus]PJJ70421.1 DNA-binding GntR family transcriptional regulator [Sediminihabitans luteus]GII97893.1 putative transcriptional regulator, GntR family protein [Sediminihabitans luteus]
MSTPADDRTPAAERAYAIVKQQILTGRLPGGALLSEAQVGAEIGVSRTPVHEAFLRLAAERLLTLETRRGAVVVPLAADETRDVLEAREAIEASAARRVCDDARAAQVAATLAPSVATMREHVATGDVEAFVAADDAFHAAVVHAAGNALLSSFYALLGDRQSRLRHQLLRVRAYQLAGAADDHAALADALAHGDPERYARVLHEHVARYRGAL